MLSGAPEATAFVSRLSPLVSKHQLVRNAWISPTYIPVANRRLLNVAYDRRLPALRSVRRRGNDLLVALDFCVFRLVLRAREYALRIVPVPTVPTASLQAPDTEALQNELKPYGELIMKLTLGASEVCFYEKKDTSLLPGSDKEMHSTLQLLDPDAIETMYSRFGVDVLVGDVCSIPPPTVAAAVGTWIRDNRNVSGAGGLLADDALWLTRLHPQTPINELRNDTFQFLMSALQWSGWRQTIALSRSEMGSVYWTESPSCPRCAAPMESDHGFVICPNCQVVGGRGEDGDGK